MRTPDDASIASIAALNEPVRRALYDYVVESGSEVTRDQAAGALRIGRALAAFHLDKLVEEGLLDTSFRRLTDRRGPGAGRPSKLYRRSDRQLAVSLPPRSYEIAAHLLSEAVAQAQSPETLDALSRVARGFGEDLGERARREPNAEESEDDRLAAAESVLEAHGFEPFRDPDGTIRLRNCPFHALAERHRALVCGMNLALMSGVAEGLHLDGVEAVLDPQPGLCCVSFRREQGA
jgi:predicted ArsR family transcriptional regulator